MSHTWKFLPLAVFAALGALLLLPGGASKPSPVSAFSCAGADVGVLRVDITDSDTGDRITVAGSVVRFSPDPDDFAGSRALTDNSGLDANPVVGRIEFEDACATTLAGELYTVELISLPAALDDCDIDVDTDSSTLPAGTTRTLDLEVNCEDLATPTSTTGPASTVVVQSSATTVACGGTTIITITVRGANGQPVASGTLVNITANIGSVSPTSGQTTADGSLFVFYTAPSTQGGAATITAAAGTATGSAAIAVNCATAPTQAPPPTTAPSGDISPPNTGDGGIANSSSWHTYAGIALIVASVIATLIVVRPRA